MSTYRINMSKGTAKNVCRRSIVVPHTENATYAKEYDKLRATEVWKVGLHLRMT